MKIVNGFKNLAEKITAGTIIGSLLLLAILAAVIVFGLVGLHDLSHVQHVTIVHRTIINNHNVTNNTYTIPSLPGNA